MNRVLQGDAQTMLRLEVEDESVDCVVTSPPYFSLRDYGVPGQIGLEDTVQDYMARLAAVFEQVRRVLKPDGTLWLNMGDTYAGSWGDYSAGGTGQREKHQARWRRNGTPARDIRLPNSVKQDGFKTKDMFGLPWRLAFILQDAGWYLRDDIIWHKPAPMPSSVKDRTTKAHEYLFLLSKSKRYYFDHEAIREPTTGGAHSKGKGVGVKAKLRRPAGWDESTGVGHGDKPPKGRYPRVKTRADFQEAVRDTLGLPERHPRSVWTIASEGCPGWHFDDHDGPDGKPCTGVHRSLDPDCPVHSQRVGVSDSWECSCEDELCPQTIAHYATFPKELARRCIAAGSREGGVVLDPFAGSGTTCIVAALMRRKFIGVELDPRMVRVAHHRLDEMPLLEAMTT